MTESASTLLTFPVSKRKHAYLISLCPMLIGALSSDSEWRGRPPDKVNCELVHKCLVG